MIDFKVGVSQMHDDGRDRDHFHVLVEFYGTKEEAEAIAAQICQLAAGDTP